MTHRAGNGCQDLDEEIVRSYYVKFSMVGVSVRRMVIIREVNTVDKRIHSEDDFRV